jgi:hypothetical protein
MDKRNEHLEGLIRDNKGMLGRRYYSDISYIPDESDMKDFPVKYGMTDNDRKECEGHNPDFARVSGTEGWKVRFVTVQDGVAYFAGPDGFVWYAPDGPIEVDTLNSYLSEWDCAYCVAAFDLHFNGDPVPFEAINYGWYLARVLSQKVWDEQDK